MREPVALSPSRYLVGFVAGVLATLLFQQAALAGLVRLGRVQATVYAMQPTHPLGVPWLLSRALWGRRCWPGLWSPRFKGFPVAAGWQPSRRVIGLLVNGAWGLGTVVLWRAWMRVSRAGVVASPA